MKLTETETLKQVYAAINRNDIASALTFFDPEIERIEPWGFPSAGTYRGHAEVKAHLEQGRGTWAEGSCEPERFAVASDRVVAFLHVRVRLKNQSDWIDARFADGFVFRDGKVMQMRTFAETQQALEWAGVKDPGA
jgi:ketosteroid isomerase-like protein